MTSIIRICLIAMYAIGLVSLFAGSAWGDVSFTYHEIDAAYGKVEVVDIDMDGHNDILMRTDNELLYFRYVKGGHFEKFVVIGGVEFSGERIAAADIDGDGDPDLVTSFKQGKKHAIVWIENSAPHADTWRLHKIGEQEKFVKDIAVADFDRDGKPDVVTREHTITRIFFQNSPTDWIQTVTLKHEDHEGMDVGDLDRDGDPDIVLNGFWYETPAEPRNWTLLKDVYDKWFTKHIFDKKWFTGTDGSWRDNNCSIKVADVNGDNLPDIIVSHSELPGYPISIYTASAVGQVKSDQWTEITVADTYDFCQTLDAGDIDHDGDLDILAAKFEREHKTPKWRNKPPYPVTVFYNIDGTGKTWKRHDVDTGGMYAGILGDVGSDGDLDIIGARTYWKGPLNLWENTNGDDPPDLDHWTYIQIDRNRGKWGDFDDPRWLRYFGLDMRDVTGDGYKDIIAGRYFYRNPGGTMEDTWSRIDVGVNVDGMLFVDVDGDKFADVIGTALPDVYWLEARDTQGKKWRARKIATLPKTGHVNGQGYMLAQIIPGGKPEVILACGDGIYCLEIPSKPAWRKWRTTRIAADTMDEGIGVGDIDRDGDIDIAAGVKDGKEYRVMWYENTGDGGGDWAGSVVSTTPFAPDRIAIADINGNGRVDIVVSEERYPGPDPDASLYWFDQPEDCKRLWKKNTVVTEYSLNNLDVVDMDGDGDQDIITGEHKGPKGNFRLQIFENDGTGKFTEHIADRGKESHLGARVADIDGDGDPDIVSTAWDKYRFLHLWRNDAMIVNR